MLSLETVIGMTIPVQADIKLSVSWLVHDMMPLSGKFLAMEASKACWYFLASSTLPPWSAPSVSRMFCTSTFTPSIPADAKIRMELIVETEYFFRVHKAQSISCYTVQGIIGFIFLNSRWWHSVLHLWIIVSERCQKDTYHLQIQASSFLLFYKHTPKTK